jgi:hypothetical protein
MAAGVAGVVDQGIAKWLGLAERIAQQVDLDTTSPRRRGQHTAAAQLGLALLYGPGGQTMRQLADTVERLDIAHVSESALLRRLMNAAGWLEDVAEELIIEQLLRGTASAALQNGSLHFAAYADWRSVAQAAKQFLLDFMPWQDGMFTAAQEQWLLCARWNFVASTIQADRATTDAGFHTLERVRVLGHLIAALSPEETI